MSVRLSSTGLAVSGDGPLTQAAGFLDSVLRGLGQVMLQNNSYAGLLFLIGIFCHSTLFGLAALVGTIVSTLAAKLVAVDADQVRDGLFGFNGALVAIALLYFLHPEALTWAYVVLASAGSTIVMAAMLRLTQVWKVPALTAPFVFTALVFLLACARFGRLHTTDVLPTAGLPASTAVEGVVSLSTVVEGLFNGLAQVFFQSGVVTGVLFALGLLVSSRRAGLAALLGSLTGLLVAWGMGAAEPAIRSGAFGFNSVLTAIALGAVFFALNWTSAAYALLATITTTVVFAAVSAALQPLGMPALTLPFVLVVWVFLLGSPLFRNLRAAT